MFQTWSRSIYTTAVFAAAGALVSGFGWWRFTEIVCQTNCLMDMAQTMVFLMSGPLSVVAGAILGLMLKVGMEQGASKS